MVDHSVHRDPITQVTSMVSSSVQGDNVLEPHPQSLSHTRTFVKGTCGRKTGNEARCLALSEKQRNKSKHPLHILFHP